MSLLHVEMVWSTEAQPRPCEEALGIAVEQAPPTSPSHQPHATTARGLSSNMSAEDGGRLCLQQTSGAGYHGSPSARLASSARRSCSRGRSPLSSRHAYQPSYTTRPAAFIAAPDGVANSRPSSSRMVAPSVIVAAYVSPTRGRCQTRRCPASSNPDSSKSASWMRRPPTVVGSPVCVPPSSGPSPGNSGSCSPSISTKRRRS